MNLDKLSARAPKTRALLDAAVAEVMRMRASLKMQEGEERYELNNEHNTYTMPEDADSEFGLPRILIILIRLL